MGLLRDTLGTTWKLLGDYSGTTWDYLELLGILLLETTWGLLVQYLEANLVRNLGLLQDTLVTTKGLLRDNLGLLGILLVNTCDLLMEYLGGYLGTT